MIKLHLDYHVSLSRILQEILSDNIKLKWNILDFDAFLTCESNFDVNRIDQLIESGNDGYEINQATLIKLSNDIQQVHQLLLVGNFHRSVLTNYEENDEWYCRNDFVIEVIDSCSDWEIWMTDEKLAYRLNLLSKNR